MSKVKSLGDLQLAIMQVLWTEGEATVSEVHQALFEERRLAPTTIATMLRKMEQKGVVAHRPEGRQFVYRAAIDRSEVHRSMVSDLVKRLFAGDPRALVSHLVEEGEVEIAEIDGLRRTLAAARKRAREDRLDH